jgi:hypothetical protein
MMRKNIIYIGIAVLCLLATIIVSISAFRTPREIEETSTLLSYNLQGSFSHQAYGYSSTGDQICVSCGETELIYFPKIIDTITGAYTYEFLSNETVSDVKAQVQISAIITSSGWSKDVVVLNSQKISGGSVTFPLDTAEYLALANTICQELGLNNVNSINLAFKATVHTEANVGGQTITEDFVQTCEATAGYTTIKWARPFDLSRKGYQSGVTYEQSGHFGYSIALLPNTLFGAATLTSPSPAIKILHKLNQASSYRSDTIDNISVSFIYNLAADKTVTGVTHEVEASVVLSNIDGAQIVFPSLPTQTYDSDFTARIPIDVTLLYDVIKKMENTTENDFDTTYNLAVKVDVHTTATEPGMIDEVISAVLPLKITSGDLSVEVATGGTKTGNLTETVMVSNSTRSTLMMISLSLLCLTVVAGLWAGWEFRESRRERSVIHELWENTRQTMEKHKDILVNVAELPVIMEMERITRVDSLTELVKLADSLLKPVLHRNDTERHTFCVIDSGARYEYFIIEPPSKKG